MSNGNTINLKQILEKIIDTRFNLSNHLIILLERMQNNIYKKLYIWIADILIYYYQISNEFKRYMSNKIV